MKRRGLASGLAVIVAWMAAGSGSASAQPVFRAASLFNLPGTTADATGIAALADVTSPGGTGPDGIPDLLTASQTQQLTVAIGRGDGTFTLGPDTDLMTIPTAMAVANLDTDAQPDIIVGDSSNTVRVFKGKSDGTFTSLPMTYMAGQNPRGIVLADFTGEGDLDAAIAAEGSQSGRLTILIGNGDGTFTESVDSYDAGLLSSGVVAGDFDGDSKLDLAVSNEFSNDISIFKGDGQGGFTKTLTLAAGDGPNAIKTTDLDGDGRLDLVVTDGSADRVAVLSGRAGGMFAPARFFPTGAAASTPRGLALADVNVDLQVDLVVVNNFSFDAAVLYGDGTGSFAPPRLFVADAEPVGVVAGDLNGDGADDVVGLTRGSQNNPTAATLLSNGDGSLKGVENIVVEGNPSAITAGDIDNDGRADVIVSQSGELSVPGSVRFALAKASGGFAEPVTLPSAGDAAAVAAGDFNADGRLDLAVVNHSTANVSVFLGAPTGGFGAVKNYPIGPTANAVVAGDWNGDGRSDLAVVQQGTGQSGSVDILIATAAGGFGAPSSVAADQLPVSIDTGDFNHDGKLDLVIANSASSNISLALGRGDGTFLAPTTTGVSGGARSVAVADFDRDGFDDMAVSLSTTPSVALLYGDGQGHFTPGSRTLSIGGNGIPSQVAARDVSGDGIPDIIVGDEVNSVIKAFVRAPAPNTRVFQTADTVGVNRRPTALAAGDVDGDGRYDAMSADSSPAPTASVLTNVRGAGFLRGDGNGDGRVSAADAVAVMRKVKDGNGIRAEDVGSRGAYAAQIGVDANGDGIVTPQDVFAVAHRTFNPALVGL